jgi:hypothetical protein
MRCVEIMIHDDGTFHVRECEPPEADEPMEGGQTFQSAEEAAAAAIQMLQAPAEGGQNELQAAMQGGYDKVRPAAGGGKMQGAGMQYQDSEM